MDKLTVVDLVDPFLRSEVAIEALRLENVPSLFSDSPSCEAGKTELDVVATEVITLAPVSSV